MARNTNIKLRRSATAGAIPTTSNLDLGELALNTYDGKLYMKTTEGSASEVVQIGSATDSYHKVRKSQTLSFTVTVVSKNSDHIYYNQGSGSGYHIDGLQSPRLHLTPGNTYRFDQSDSSNSGHPLRFYYEADKTTSYTTGVTTNGTPGSSGAYTQITATETTPIVLHYQCSAHGYMGNAADFGTRNLTGFDTDDLTEGSSNLYFTNARAQAVSINNVVEDTTPQLGGDLASNGNDILFADNDKAIFGTGSDLQIYHDGNHSRIVESGSGDMIIQGDEFSLMNTAGTEYMIFADNDSFVKLYFNGSNKLATTSTGIDVTGTVTSDGLRVDNVDSIRPTTNTSSILISGGDTTSTGANYSLFGGNHSTLANVHRWRTGGSEAARIDSSGNLLVGTTDATPYNNNAGSTADNGIVLSEAGWLAAARYQGTVSFLNRTGNDGDIAVFRKDGTTIGSLGTRSAGFVVGSGDVGLFFDAGVDRIFPESPSGGTARDNAIDLGTSAARFKDFYLGGTANIGGNLVVTGDLTINGTTTTLNTATLNVEDKNITLNFGSGDTSSTASGAGITIQDAVNSSTDATILWDATNDEFDFSHPVNITGRVVATGVSQFADVNIPDNNAIRFGNSQDLQIFHNGTNSVIDSNTGALLFDVEGNTQFETNNFYVLVNNNEIGLRAFANGGVELYYDGNKKIQTISTGIQTFGTVNVNGAYTLPTSDGTSGQVLQTDGSGTLSFATVSAGGGGTVSEAFKNIAVSGQTNIIADSATDTLTFAAGSNITLTTTPGTDTLTIAASGGEVTVQDEGSSLSTAATTLNFVGAGVTASGTGATKTITIAGTGSVSEAFKTIAVSGQSSVVADGATDTLTLAAGSGMTLTTDASTDTITFASSGGGGTQSGIFKEFIFTPSSSTTTFTGSDANSNTLSYTVNAVDVFLNGIKLQPTTDFTASNGSSVVLVNAASSGDVLQINAYTQVLGFGDSNLSELSGDGSTTDFTIAANPNHENNTQVYIDGVYQEKGTYSVSGTTLAFGTAPPNGTSIEVVIGSRNVTIDDVSGLTVNGDLTVDTDVLYVDSTNNRVGIGTVSPASNLHIVGPNNAAGGITLGGPTETNGQQKVGRIKTAHYNTSEEPFTALLTNAQQTANLVNIGGASGAENAATDIKFFTAANNTTLTGTQRMIINSSGNVGIGTASPSHTLDVTAGATAASSIRVDGGHASLIIDRASTSYDSNLSFQTNGATKWRLWNNSNDTTLAIRDEANAADVMTWETGGNVGIGINNPDVSLDIGSKTDAIRVPNGTTGQRPTAALGQLRYNTTTSEFEGYADGAWGKIGGGGDSFGTIAVSGQSNIVAEQENDTLTIVGAGGITATTTAGTDTLTLTGQTSVNPFTTDFFTSSGSAAFTLSVTPPSEDNLIVFLEGVYQNKNSYALSGTTLTLDSAPASGQEVVVHIIQNGVVGAGHVVDEFTGDGSDTTFTLSATPLNENNTFVYLDGVYQEKSVYSVSGTTLTFDTAPVSGHSIEVVTPQVSEINQPAAGSINNVNMFDDTTMMGSTVTSTTMTTTSATTIASHAAATYRTVKYLVQLTQGTNYHSTEVNLIHDGSTVYITEYGSLFNSAALGTLDATTSSGNILLKLTPGSNSSLTARVVSTAVPV